MTAGVDLTNCDREPIHIPGSIQPHGAMLVCEPASYRIMYASANLGAMTGYAGAAPAGLALAAVLGDQVAHDVRNAAAKAGDTGAAGVVLGVRLETIAAPVDLLVHRYKDRAFIEIEPSAASGPDAHQALDTTQTLIRRIGLETGVEAIAASGARLLRAMLGYDRVMVYQFLHNGAGQVIAEAKRAGLQSFLNQHFPASDIPYQARRLYLANTIRMIGDASYAPIPLLPPLAADEAPVDMSFAQLRSVSPIHCEYLQNMGVRASMSISIVVEGELWGLISCHHDRPKVAPLPMRIAAELFGQYFSLQISAAERRAHILAATTARESLDKIVANLALDGVFDLHDHLADFGALIESAGVGLWIDGEWASCGATPPGEAIPQLLNAASETRGAVWSTQSLGAGEAGEPSEGAVVGMLAIPISTTPRDYLLFFRREEAHNIDWAGQPVKAVVSTPHGDRLTPRGSFDTWREEVKGRSKPWTTAELAIADAIRTYLRDVVLRQNEVTAEERARSERRRRILNDELNHRVKNIITLVKSIALQTGAHALSVAHYSATLEGRLRALAFAHDQSLGGSNNGDISALIEAEASLHRFGGAPDRVIAKGHGVRLDDQAFGVLALVVHEMMTNAAKYGALSTPAGRLEIAWRFNAAGDCELTWTERGGPTVESPSRKGFGSKLIHSTVSYDLRGSARVDYNPGGVEAVFIIPAAHVSRAPAEDTAHSPTSERLTALSDFKALVVEDHALIAMDIEETLKTLGALEVRLAPDTDEAAAILRDFRPDVAILDLNLGAGTSEDIADVLGREQVPFIFATGYGDSVMIPLRFKHIPVVRKPVHSAALAAQIEAAFALKSGEKIGSTS